MHRFDRRTFLAWLATLPVLRRVQHGSTQQPFIEVRPTALFQQPDGRKNLVRITVSGLSAPAARARVTDRRGALVGTAGLAGNLSLEHWRFVFFEFSETRLALQNTFVLGVSAATAGTLLVTLVGYLSLRKLVWGHRYLAFLATAPVAIPGIVLAVGLFLSYTRPPLVLYGTLSIIFLAYVTKELPVGYQQIASSLRAVHPELEDASRIFGATRLRALF